MITARIIIYCQLPWISTSERYFPLLNNEKDVIDTDEETSANNFYEIVKTGITKTSQAAPGEVMKMYNELLKKYDELIHYPIAE
jgi:fatty acid-binding protein DegV